MALPPNVRWIVLGTVFSAVAGAMVALWVFPERSQEALERTGVADATGQLAVGITELTSGTAAPVLSRLGLAGAAEAAEPRTDVELPAPAPRVRPAAVAPPPEVVPEVPAVVAPAILTPPDPLPGVAAPSAIITVEDRLYTVDEPGITPARPLQATFPTEPSPGADPNRIGVVEYVVNEFGAVQSVRILRGPSTVLDSIVLPAIKAWRFEPAMKDGRPVKIRQTIRLTY